MAHDWREKGRFHRCSTVSSVETTRIFKLFIGLQKKRVARGGEAKYARAENSVLLFNGKNTRDDHIYSYSVRYAEVKGYVPRRHRSSRFVSIVRCCFSRLGCVEYMYVLV